MKIFKHSFFLFFAVLFSIGSYAQETNGNTKLYFLADTTNTPKESRFMSIGKISPFTSGYTIFCKCLVPYQNHLQFSYRIGKDIPLAPVVNSKPIHQYTNWTTLQELIIKNHKYFNDIYDLYIVEALPGNRYKTNKVKLDIYTTIKDGVTVKDGNPG